jgi:putative transcription factor
VIIEGAKLAVCIRCSKLGKIYYEEPKPKGSIPKSRPVRLPLRVQTRKVQGPTAETSLELVEDFDSKIRQAREKLALSHEELGKKINEKVSLLRKIETGKMKPDNRLAATLEHVLKVRLIVPAGEEKMPQAKMPRPASRELTLGDLIQLDKKIVPKEDATGRKRS